MLKCHRDGRHGAVGSCIILHAEETCLLFVWIFHQLIALLMLEVGLDANIIQRCKCRENVLGYARRDKLVRSSNDKIFAINRFISPEQC